MQGPSNLPVSISELFAQWISSEPSIIGSNGQIWNEQDWLVLYCWGMSATNWQVSRREMMNGKLWPISSFALLRMSRLEWLGFVCRVHFIGTGSSVFKMKECFNDCRWNLFHGICWLEDLQFCWIESVVCHGNRWWTACDIVTFCCCYF